MQKKTKEKQTNDDESDLESIASEEFEEMLDKMSGHKELDDDIDYMNDVDKNLKNNANKKLKNVQTNSDESEIDSDMDDLGEENEDEGGDDDSIESEDIEPDDEDSELLRDLDDDNMSDIVFESHENKDDIKIKKKLKKKGDINSIFASAEEFASILDDEGTSSKTSGTLDALYNKDNAGTFIKFKFLLLTR